MTQTSISRRKNTVFFRKDGRIILLDIHDIIYIELFTYNHNLLGRNALFISI